MLTSIKQSDARKSYIYRYFLWIVDIQGQMSKMIKIYPGSNKNLNSAAPVMTPFRQHISILFASYSRYNSQWCLC